MKKNKPSGKKGQMKQARTVKAPVATNRSMLSKRMSSNYKQSERIAAIAPPATTSFEVLGTYPVNPGISDTFPWLSGHAALFEKYEIRALHFKYKNLLSTTTNGNVIMAFSFDTLDAAPSSAIVATQKAAYIDGAPWREITLRVPIRRKELYTRVGDVPPNADLKTYDYGKLWVCSEGITGAGVSSIGYLEVVYEIELKDKSELITPYSALYTKGAVTVTSSAEETVLSSNPSIGGLSYTVTFADSEMTYSPTDSAALTASSGAFPIAFPSSGSVSGVISFVAEGSPAAFTAGPPNAVSWLAGALFPITYTREPLAVVGSDEQTYTGLCFFSINVPSPSQANLVLGYSNSPTFAGGESWILHDLQIHASWSPLPL